MLSRKLLEPLVVGVTSNSDVDISCCYNLIKQYPFLNHYETLETSNIFSPEDNYLPITLLATEIHLYYSLPIFYQHNNDNLNDRC